jgi:aminomethyltransferase
MSPVLEKGIGMGYINTEYSAFGTQVFVKIRNRNIPATVVKMPFIIP